MQSLTILFICVIIVYTIFKDILYYKSIKDLQEKLMAKNLTEYKDLKKEEKEEVKRPEEEKEKYVPLDEAPLNEVRDAFEGSQKEEV